MKRVYRPHLLAGGFVCLLLSSLDPATAIVRKADSSDLDRLSRSTSGIWDDRQVAGYEAVASRLADRGPWDALVRELGPNHRLFLDVRTGEPSLVMGAPVPLIPGSANDLPRSAAIDEAHVAQAAGEFLASRQHLLAAPLSELALRGAHRVNDNLWVVTYQQRPSGIPVLGSRVTLVIGHGNLIMWGSEHSFPLAAATPTLPSLSAPEAHRALRSYVGWQDGTDTLIATPELVYLPLKGGPAGLLARDLEGRTHRLVWELVFKREGTLGTWLGQIDATTGEVVQFGDINKYASVRGGIEPLTWTDVEESRPLPLVNIGGGSFTSLEGQYTFPGGTVTGSLDGELAVIADQCGGAPFPTVDSDAGGDIDFGIGPPNPNGDADCTNNGVGNAGGDANTHAGRSSYYHITRLKDKVRRWLPSNTWVDSAHSVRVNINNTCNAYWSPGGGFNGFFQEGFNANIPALCYNTGEVASVFLHEVGHGMDQNDVQGTADGGTGEAYADVVSILDLHRSCIGDVFWDMQCTGYGLPCTSCQGVRDADYATHVDGGGVPVATPFTPTNYTGPFCPGAFFGAGPCNKEVHCEAYPANGAIWDLGARKLNVPFDQATAWWIAERDWQLAMDISTSMFNCNSTTFASDGCAATSWFQAMLAIDDDDGDLTNGTPHAAELFDAFNDHDIACGNAGDPENQNASSCPSLTTPVANVTFDGTDNTVTWSAVANAQGYAVLRNHGDCAGGYRTITTVASTNFTDTDVADFQDYTYRVVALGGAGGPEANACYSHLSDCAVPFAGMQIFTDGFESADVSAWSSSAP